MVQEKNKSHISEGGVWSQVRPQGRRGVFVKLRKSFEWPRCGEVR